MLEILRSCLHHRTYDDNNVSHQRLVVLQYDMWCIGYCDIKTMRWFNNFMFKMNYQLMLLTKADMMDLLLQVIIYKYILYSVCIKLLKKYFIQRIGSNYHSSRLLSIINCSNPAKLNTYGKMWSILPCHISDISENIWEMWISVLMMVYIDWNVVMFQ